MPTIASARADGVRHQWILVIVTWSCYSEAVKQGSLSAVLDGAMVVYPPGGCERPQTFVKLLCPATLVCCNALGRLIALP